MNALIVAFMGSCTLSRQSQAKAPSLAFISWMRRSSVTPLEVWSKMRVDMDEAMRRSVGPIPPGYTLTVIGLARAVFGHDGNYWYGYIDEDGKEAVVKMEKLDESSESK